jgi:hypothetical protein
MEELAPELLPMLVSLESPANFIPVTNNLLAELQRRGVSRDKLLSTLQRAGQDMPAASVKMLKMLSRKQVRAPCPALPCPALPRPALPCPALPASERPWRQPARRPALPAAGRRACSCAQLLTPYARTCLPAPAAPAG